MTRSAGSSETAVSGAMAFLRWTPSGMVRGGEGAVGEGGRRGSACGVPVGLGHHSDDELVVTLRNGLPVAAFEELRDALGISTRALAETTNIALRTLARRKAEGRFRKDESERVLRIGTLLDRAIEVLEGKEAARQWLTSPKRALGGQTPLEYADTEPGARAVEALLTRLEYGVFS